LFLFFQCLTQVGGHCGLDFVAGSYISPLRRLDAGATACATTLDDILAWPRTATLKQRKSDVDHDRA